MKLREIGLKALAMATAALLLGCSASPLKTQPMAAGTRLPMLRTTQDFCVEAQRILAHTDRVAANVVYQDYDAFIKSKPAIEPLTIEQFVTYDDPARERPKMVSCKMKSTDHLIAHYGPQSAGIEGSCAEFTRTMLDLAEGELQQSGVPLAFDKAKIVVDPDDVVSLGPKWLESGVMVYTDAQNRLHIRSGALRADWTDPQFASAPERFRGNHYCHFIAPEYLRRLLAGEVEPALISH